MQEDIRCLRTLLSIGLGEYNIGLGATFRKLKPSEKAKVSKRVEMVCPMQVHGAPTSMDAVFQGR